MRERKVFVGGDLHCAQKYSKFNRGQLNVSNYNLYYLTTQKVEIFKTYRSSNVSSKRYWRPKMFQGEVGTFGALF